MCVWYFTGETDCNNKRTRLFITRPFSPTSNHPTYKSGRRKVYDLSSRLVYRSADQMAQNRHRLTMDGNGIQQQLYNVRLHRDLWGSTCKNLLCCKAYHNLSVDWGCKYWPMQQTTTVTYQCNTCYPCHGDSFFPTDPPQSLPGLGKVSCSWLSWLQHFPCQPCQRLWQPKIKGITKHKIISIQVYSRDQRKV